jgi:hypothetical protein
VVRSKFCRLARHLLQSCILAFVYKKGCIQHQDSKKMVGVTAVAVGAIIATGGAAAPAVVAATAEGIAAGGIGAGAVIGGAATTGAAVAGSAGIGASAGALTGAVITGTATGASVGAAAGTAAATAVSATGGGAATLVTGGLALGPVGWFALGATSEPSEEPTLAGYTYDCWKQVLRETSCKSLNGKLLRDVVVDERIKHVTLSTSNDSMGSLPDIILENIWDERFHIEYVTLLPTNEVAAHAVRLE